ncbi:DTX3L [Bugula neritina]|uniref:E3 ubiquitin-protein ligase n=1 Tax=Bugula neritina TaxID=10212 RepID=A0A7J7JKC2_BUGNE|nr:DTX3L [Bugula neritina]
MEFRKKRSKTHSLGLSGQVKRKRFSTITADTSEILSGKVGKATTGSTSADMLVIDETSTSNSSVDVCCASNDASGGAAEGTPTGLKDDECPICMDKLDRPQALPCSHKFCKDCLDQVKSTSKSNLCPVCRVPFAVAEGKQPTGGNMVHRPEHPNPGKEYSGTFRFAYLPNNTKGKLVLSLLYKAFRQRLVFTVGRSITTGNDNTVVWNDIHHKTSMTGGPTSYGYPDPGYLNRVIEDLKAKGITA